MVNTLGNCTSRNGKRTYFKKINFKNLCKQFTDLKINIKNVITVNEMQKWINKHYFCSISMFAIDPLLNVFHKHIAINCRGTLCFVINNGHLYPIFNTDLKKMLQKEEVLN